jgi:hypothetical protein
VGTLPVVPPRINEGWERYGVGGGRGGGGRVAEGALSNVEPSCDYFEEHLFRLDIC